VSHDTSVYRFECCGEPAAIDDTVLAWHVELRLVRRDGGGATGDGAAGAPAAPEVPDADDAAVVRDYTPISDAAAWRSGAVELLIKRYPTGRLTSLLPSLAVGTTVQISSPSPTITAESLGVAHEQPTPLAVGIVVGGTGITPALQLLRRALGAGSQFAPGSRFWLLYSNRTEADILLRESIDELRRE
jgi:cytochrome-b5 reductase